MDQAFRPVFFPDLRKFVGGKIESFIPGDPDESAFGLLEGKFKSLLGLDHRL